MQTERELASPEQRLYAQWLDAGTRIGFLLLVATFFLYVFEIIPPGIALADLPRYWHLPAAEFNRATGAPEGWAWITRLGEGELANFLGVAVLGLVTVVCYARILPRFARHREWIFVAICVCEIVVLAAAAAGIAGSGH